MAVSAHHNPTPSLAIWRRFSVPHPLSLCRFQLVTFLLPLCFLFLLLFKCQESQPVEEVMHGKARLLELSLGQESKGPFALEVGAESTSTWTSVLCEALWSQDPASCVGIGSAVGRQPAERSGWGARPHLGFPEDWSWKFSSCKVLALKTPSLFF